MTNRPHLLHVMTRILLLTTIATLGFFLFLRFQMAFAQHFDMDEYAYLHWAAHIVRGEQPFRDFFYFLPPGFLWFLVPVFWIFPNGLAPVFAARVLEYGAFILLAGSACWLFWEYRRRWTALIVPVILLFLPLPSIKFTEIRPDTLGMAFVVLAMVYTTKFLRKHRSKDGFLAGLFYGISLLVMPKMAPAVAVGFLMMLLRLPWPLMGFATVAVSGVAWLLGTGGWQLLGRAWYLIILLPLETQTKLGAAYPISIDFFFHPNAYFYGVGSDIGRITNHAIWMIAGVIAVWRLLIRRDVLIGVTFIAQIIFFLAVSTHHAQYFIPLAVGVAWYFADGIDVLWQLLRRKAWGSMVFGALFITGMSYLVYVSLFVYRTRWVLPMRDTFTLLTKMWNTIPATEYILDLEGITLYYPDPYYVCCIPFGQTQQYWSRPLPSLADTLEKSHTNYIYQGSSLRANTLTLSDQVYITENFEPWEGHDALLVRKSPKSL